MIDHNRAKIWLDSIEDVEATALAQIDNIVKLPMLYRHLAVMPDVHAGDGATIGSVIPLIGAVMPCAVGVDIGCGMCAYPTGIMRGDYADAYWVDWLMAVGERVPSGFNKHDEISKARADAVQDICAESDGQVRANIKPGRSFANVLEMQIRQLGTLGGGNHFIEAQYDQDGQVWIMLHSGSRKTGFNIALWYSGIAKQLNTHWHSNVPPGLHFLPLGTDAHKDYMHDMNWALNYALANRKLMMREALAALNIELDESRMINIHHNYAAWEHHFGQNVIIHRKGATRLRENELGIIPGSMGTSSYIVRGKGNADSYHSCSHGAGRVRSRTATKRAVSVSEFADSIAHTLTPAHEAYLDECPAAYKDVDKVIELQYDILDVVHKLKPIITLKGE